MEILSGEFTGTEVMRTLIVWLIILFPIALSAQRSDAQREKEVRIYLDSATRVNDPVEIAEAHYRLAKIEQTKLNILESNRNLFKSIRILEKKGPSYELGRNYLWLAHNAQFMRDKDELLQYVETALEIFKACNSDRGKMLAYGGLGHFYGYGFLSLLGKTDPLIRPDYDKALHYLQLGETYALKLKDGETLEKLKLTMQKFLARKTGKGVRHDMESGLEYLKTDTNRHDKITLKLDYASYLISKGRESEGLKWLEECQVVISRYYPGNKYILKSLERAWADYYICIKDYKSALEHVEKLNEYQIQVLAEDREGAISNLHVQFETEKKDAEIQQQEQNLRITRRYLWITGTLLLTALLLSAVLYRLYKKNRSISQKNALLVREQNHRVKNNLQVVSSLLNLQANMLDDPGARLAIEDAQLRISAMVHLHRQLYENGQVDRIDMERFIPDLTESVLESFDLRHVTLIQVATGILLPADTATLLGLLINELVTNACKYAFADHPAPVLNIELSKGPGNTLTLIVKDNGLKSPDLKNNRSFGSKLINMMVTQLDGTLEYTYQNGLQFSLTF
ncbi:MAG: sensor histidine kinase [Leadbetterella sp.]|nr:sensor histidine kinase [Leadbetterella sp.]